MSYIENGILCGVSDNDIKDGTFMIPDGITEIMTYAFWNCRSLERITIPTCVVKIGNGIFDNCVSLKKITIPESVTEIGKCVFDYCSSLRSVEIKNPNTVINDQCPFFGCTSLKTVKIGNTVHPVECINGYCTEILSCKQDNIIEIIHAKYFNTDKEFYTTRKKTLWKTAGWY